jgi:transposase-like protein
MGVTDYGDNIKAQALAALIAGQSYTEVARAFNVPIGTLKSWKSRDVAGLDAGDASSATAKKERIGALLLDYLVSTLETLKAQQVVFADRGIGSHRPACKRWPMRAMPIRSAMAARPAAGSPTFRSAWPAPSTGGRSSFGACSPACAG